MVWFCPHYLIHFSLKSSNGTIAMPIEIDASTFIPDDEVGFTTSRSGGPGGQNVNKVETRVTLWFNVEGSAVLSPGEKQLVTERLSSRINKEGLLWVTSSRHRTQYANRESAIERFAALLREALAPAPQRRPTRITPAARAERLKHKKRRSLVKQLRRERFSPE